MVSKRSAIVALAGAFLVLLPSCGDDAEPRRTIVIETTDQSKEKSTMRAPKSVRAGLVDIELENEGDSVHDAQLFRITGKHTKQDLISLMESLDGDVKPRWASPRGGVAPVRPGDTGTVTQVLEPGSYFIADTQEKKGVWPTVNAAKGAIKKIEVRGKASGELPSTSASIVARDKGFEMEGLSAGDNRITFENATDELRHVVAFRLRKGIPFKDAVDWLKEDDFEFGWMPVDGVDPTHTTTVLESGGKQVTDFNLGPGRYALVCVVSDRRGSLSHFEQGLMTELNLE
jgi:hypothetical protein